MNNESIKKHIRKAREENNLTQEEIASGIGMTRNAYRDIEVGGTKLLSDSIFKIADITGLSPEELVLGYLPVEESNSSLKDAREKLMERIRSLREEYDAQVERLESENSLLRALIKEKDDNICHLKSLVDYLEKSGK